MRSSPGQLRWARQRRALSGLLAARLRRVPTCKVRSCQTSPASHDRRAGRVLSSLLALAPSREHEPSDPLAADRASAGPGFLRQIFVLGCQSRFSAGQVRPPARSQPPAPRSGREGGRTLAGTGRLLVSAICRSTGVRTSPYNAFPAHGIAGLHQCCRVQSCASTKSGAAGVECWRRGPRVIEQGVRRAPGDEWGSQGPLGSR